MNTRFDPLHPSVALQRERQAIRAAGEARPGERLTRAEAAALRDLVLSLAEGDVLAALDSLFRTMTDYRGLRNPTADAIELRNALAARAADAWERIVAPALIDAFARGASAANVLIRDLNADAVADWIASAGDRIVGRGTGLVPAGDALAQNVPIADALVGEWRQALTDAQTFGWDPRRTRTRLAAAFDWTPGGERPMALLDELDALNDDIDRWLRNSPFDTRNAAEAAGAFPSDMQKLAAHRDSVATRLRKAEGNVRTGWAARAERIARTETVGAFNAGTDAGARSLGAARQWLATYGARTRDAHLAADGQCRPTGEPFTVGGEQLRYPGDPSGSAGNIVNCRCTILVLPDGCGSEGDDVALRDQRDLEIDRRGDRFDPGATG